jgi:hypothetical protein
MEEITPSKFHCCRAAVASHVYVVEAGNAREAAIKAAPLIVKDLNSWHEDSVLVVVRNDKDEVESWRVSIQRKFTLDEGVKDND